MGLPVKWPTENVISAVFPNDNSFSVKLLFSEKVHYLSKNMGFIQEERLPCTPFL